jgi:AcrR family transcriptional regulator
MNKTAQDTTHRRIIDSAAKLFYDHGIGPVGVTQICETANVSKRTLYKHFETKDSLASAAMESLGKSWFDACTSSTANTPEARITHVFTMIEEVADKPDFYGCIFMNTSIELRGTNVPAASTVKEFKAKLYTYFEQQATAMNHSDPRELAEQLILLHDGACAWIVMRRSFPASVFKTLALLLQNVNVDD